MVAAKPLKDSLLRHRIVPYVVALQRTGAIVVSKLAYRFLVFCFLRNGKLSLVIHAVTPVRPVMESKSDSSCETQMSYGAPADRSGDHA